MMLGREATGMKAKGGSPCCLWSRCAKLSPFLDDFFESHLSSSFRNWLLTWNVLNNQLCLTETCSEESLPHSENWRYNKRKFQYGCVLLRLYVNKAGYLCIYGMLIYVAQTLNGKKTVHQQKTRFWRLQVLWISIPLLLSLSYFSWQALSSIWAATSVHHFK